jgi:hypothetical protein
MRTYFGRPTARPLQRLAVFIRIRAIMSLNREPWSETRPIVATVARGVNL